MVAMRLAGYLSVEDATSNGGDASREYFSVENASPPLVVAFCAWGCADDEVQICRFANAQMCADTKKPLSVVTLKEAVKIKLAATYSPAGVQYHRRGWS